MKLYLTLFSLIALLSACSSIHNRNNEYLEAKSEPSLKVPEGINNTEWKQSYPIPKGDTSNVKPVSMVPPGLAEDEAIAVKEQAADKAAEKAEKKAGKKDE